MTQPTLLFVYNADSGKINALKDYVHKIVKPSTYPCSLCAVTYGNFGMKQEWKDFVQSLGISVEFLHRDEFNAQYQVPDATYPAAYLKTNDKLTLLITREEMNATQTLDEMIKLVRKKTQHRKLPVTTPNL